MWYAVDGLPAGTNAAAFCPPPPPVVTDAADSSMGLVTSRVTMFSGEVAPPPASVGLGHMSEGRNVAGNPGLETGVLHRLMWVARPAVGFGELVPNRPNEQLPVPATALPNPTVGPAVASRRPRFTGKGQVGWPRAFQRWPNIAGSGG